GSRRDGRRSHNGLRYARTTTTGILLWVSTLTVSLPSTTAETPRRPWEAITIASHPLFRAVSIIASWGCACSTCTTSQGTPAAAAASVATLRYFAVRAATRFLYSSGVSVTMLGSAAKNMERLRDSYRGDFSVESFC